jgi:hypothetical protein
MKIYTNGDSHASLWAFAELQRTKPDKYYCVSRSGALAYTIPKHIPWILGRLKDVKPEDCVIFSYGEVDIRNHVHKYVTDTISYTEVIDNIIDIYVKSIFNIKSQLNFKKTCILNILPVKKTNEKYDPSIHGVYAFKGSTRSRQLCVNYANTQLKHICDLHNFIFVDIQKHVTTSDGYLDPLMSDGDVHVNEKAAIFYEDFVNNYIITSPS